MVLTIKIIINMQASSLPLTIKLFLGIQANGEIKMLQNQSILWKQDKILANQKLVEAHFQNKEYIGKFVESSLPYQQLQEKADEIKRELQQYFPSLNTDKHKLYLFPQLFLS